MPGILERPVAPTRHRLDVDAFYKMAEAGILTESPRVELIDGDIIDMTPIGSAHAGYTSLLIERFAALAVERRVCLTSQTPLRLDAFNEPQPDVMLLKRRKGNYRIAIPARTTSCFSSKSLTVRSTTTAASSSPSTPGSACRRSGSSIFAAAPSRSAETPRRRPTLAASDSRAASSVPRSSPTSRSTSHRFSPERRREVSALQGSLHRARTASDCVAWPMTPASS